MARERVTKPLGLAALAGALYFTGFAGIDVWPLSFVALVPLFAVLDRYELSGRQALAVGMVFGSVTNWGGYYWLIGMLEDFSGFPYLACVFFFLVICAYQGGQLALFFLLLYWGKRRGAPMLWLAPFAYAALEALYPLLFPSYFANCLHELPVLMQIADLGGPTLISAVMVFVNAALYALLRSWRGRVPLPRGLVATAAAALLFTLGYGQFRVSEVDARAAAAPKLEVGVVQTNMGIFAKRRDRREGQRRHLAQSAELERKVAPELLVWPESALAYAIPGDAENVKPLLGSLTTPVLFGALSRRTEDGKTRLYNTAFLVDGEGNILATYDKTYLLAFGEYLPFGEQFPILYDWSPHSGRFTPGSHTRPMPLGDFLITTLVCYEDVLPGFVRKAMAGADTHLLVNITNDAWFGDTTEPWIHLALAKLRAVEHHRYLVRATNSGVSAIVDPVGRVVTHSGVMVRANLSADVAMLQGKTLFAQVGDWPGWLGVLLSFYWVALRRRAKVRMAEQ